MRKNLLVSVLFAVFGALVLYSCLRDDEAVRHEGRLDNPLTMSEARSLFKAEVERTTRPDGSRSISFVPYDFTPHWGRATYRESAHGSSYTVPILAINRQLYARRDSLPGDLGGKPFAVRVTQSVVIVKNSESGGSSIYIQTVVPDRKWFNRHRNTSFVNVFDSGFSGYALLHDMGGNAVELMAVREGSIYYRRFFFDAGSRAEMVERLRQTREVVGRAQFMVGRPTTRDYPGYTGEDDMYPIIGVIEGVDIIADGVCTCNVSYIVCECNKCECVFETHSPCPACQQTPNCGMCQVCHNYRCQCVCPPCEEPPPPNDGGGGGTSENQQPDNSFAKMFETKFDTSQCSAADAAKLKQMVKNMYDKGQLSKKLLNSLKGKFKLAILRDPHHPNVRGRYDFETGTIYLIEGATSSEVFHETFHAYQHQNWDALHPGIPFNQALINAEMEAWIATAVYAKSVGWAGWTYDDENYGWASKVIARHLDSNGMPDYSGWRSVDKGRKTPGEIFNDHVGSLKSSLQDSNTGYNDPRYTYSEPLHDSGNGFNVFRNFLR